MLFDHPEKNEPWPPDPIKQTFLPWGIVLAPEDLEGLQPQGD